ncbi:MAG: N-succinylarginine dihydrolase [Pseudomonadota bacterium]
MKAETTIEANFDGLVGPSHNYAGLSLGNVASKNNALSIANPKQAALQGLQKMKTLHDLGYVQGVLPPHLRPNTTILRAIGFTGKDHEVIAQGWLEAPDITTRCFSASAMWTANAATFSPSADTNDGRAHFTPANLSSMFHRSFEADFTGKVLNQIFGDPNHFAHHQPLPSGRYFGDEGAANHTRLADSHSSHGVELFVYGEQVFNDNEDKPKRYPARQSLEASQAVARLHGLDPEKVVFAKQNPAVIDQGVFHNDVIAVGTTSCLFYHELAFADESAVIAEIAQKLNTTSFRPVKVPMSKVSVQDAISTYLFNTQLLERNSSNDEPSFLLIAPVECQENPRVLEYLSELKDSDAPIDEIQFFNLRESMKNGGGPACLRFRVQLTQAQLSSIDANVLFNDQLHSDLELWVNEHYRDQITEQDLRDPALIDELKTAASELESILALPDLYEINH